MLHTTRRRFFAPLRGALLLSLGLGTLACTPRQEPSGATSNPADSPAAAPASTAASGSGAQVESLAGRGLGLQGDGVAYYRFVSEYFHPATPFYSQRLEDDALEGVPHFRVEYQDGRVVRDALILPNGQVSFTTEWSYDELGRRRLATKRDQTAGNTVTTRYFHEGDQEIIVRSQSSHTGEFRIEEAGCPAFRVTYSPEVVMAYCSDDFGQELDLGAGSLARLEWTIVPGSVHPASLRTHVRPDASNLATFEVEDDCLHSLLYHSPNGDIVARIDNHTVGNCVLDKQITAMGTLIVTQQYDGNACLVRSSSIDVANPENSVISEQEVDAACRPVNARIFDGNRNPMINQGYHHERITYNELGRPVEIVHFGIQGEPVNNNGGFHRAVMEWDANGCITLGSYFDAAGDPVAGPQGFFREHVVQSENCRATRISYSDIRGEPAAIEGDVYQFAYTYNEQGLISRTDFLGRDGNPATDSVGAAWVEFYYDDMGRKISEAIRSADGSLFTPPE